MDASAALQARGSCHVSLSQDPTTGRHTVSTACLCLYMLPKLNAVCDHARKVRKLGEGAFATVEECVLRGGHVAVKRLKPELFADVLEVNDFLLEGVLIAQVHHPCAFNPGLNPPLMSNVWRSTTFCWRASSSPKCTTRERCSYPDP